jgi:hypothetical protein
MADIIPLAIGYGIPEKETWIMTPAELIAAIKALGKRRRVDLYNLDGMFAGVKKFFGGKEGSDIDDFRIYEEPVDEGEMTAKDWEHHLMLIASTYKPPEA